MNKKSLYGISCIAAAAVLAILAVTLYGRSIKLNYIEQIHLQDGYLYYVDRGKSEDLKIIRSDPEGKRGDVIICKKHNREKYRMISQIFFDSQENVYVLLKEINVESWAGISYKVYQCDFKQGKLVETEYDLTEDADEYSRISIQHIRDGKLYYVGIPDSEKKAKSVDLCFLDQKGKKEILEEVPIEYPYLNAQFFLSRNGILLWTDYAGEVRVKEIGAEGPIKIKGITGKSGVFKSLSDDGTGAYVLDYKKECIRYIDLTERKSEVLFSQKEIQKDAPEFSFQNFQTPDYTRTGFCAGVKDKNGLVSICSYQDGKHRDISEISLTLPAVLHRMAWIYGGITLTAVILCLYWLARVKYHLQTILVRLCLVFLLGLLVMDGFLEYWIEQSMREQLGGNQTFALSALGKVLEEDIIHNIEENADSFPSGGQALMLSHRSMGGDKGIGELCTYVYSIFHSDEEGKLYVSKSMSEYSGVPVEWVYAPEVAEGIYQAFDTGGIINMTDENRNGKRNNQFIPLVLGDGTKYGVLAVSVGGNIQDYQVWYYQWNLKNVSSALLLALTAALLVILYIFLRPLKTLKECAGKLASGNLGVTVAVRGHDEVADISSAFNQMSLEIEKYVQDIQGMSDGYYKFIPAKILDLLGKESIQEVELGDQMMGDFTILSLHAMDYPKQRISFSEEQVCMGINQVLSMLVEPINSHSGVVEHFEDTGLSAFFTEKVSGLPSTGASAAGQRTDGEKSRAVRKANGCPSSKEALDAAIDIQNLLERMMPGNSRTIAISYGRVMIGIIGHERRMEAATISAHSDLAKALRLKGDKYGAHILITHLVYKQIPDFEEHYHARYLGNIYLAADNSYERVYDVYDGDSEEEFYYKEQTRQLFEQGVGLFVARKFYEARLVFVEVLKQHRKDKAAKEYLYRCDKYYKLAAEEEIETVIEKF